MLFKRLPPLDGEKLKISRPTYSHEFGGCLFFKKSQNSKKEEEKKSKTQFSADFGPGQNGPTFFSGGERFVFKVIAEILGQTCCEPVHKFVLLTKQSGEVRGRVSRGGVIRLLSTATNFHERARGGVID